MLITVPCPGVGVSIHSPWQPRLATAATRMATGRGVTTELIRYQHKTSGDPSSEQIPFGSDRDLTSAGP